MSITPGKLICAALLLAASGQITPALAQQLACDDGIKTAFKPDAETTVVAVRQIKKGEELKAPDAPQPITAAADICLVKLLVGPGATAEKDKTARSYSEGIGIEVWLPAPSNWNERIRNYGGGGWVGGGHRVAGQIGSKVPAIVNANIGYASGTTDAGQPWYQDGSFSFLSDGKLNTESLRDFSVRAMVEQAVKTKALVNVYYGKAPKYAYYDGHSQGGRQGMKVFQEYPELYDGYLIAQPAPNIAKFGTSGLYPQIVMKTELGFTSVNKDAAKAFAAKVAAANQRAVAACDTAGLGFLLDPFACNYNPARDAAALCAGAAGDGVTGGNPDAATCMSAKEAMALNRIWYGATPDGSFDAAQTPESRSGKSLGPKQIWWAFTRGTGIGNQITSAGVDSVAQALQDVSYAADSSATAAIPITNASTTARNKWLELDYAGLADAVAKNVALQPTHFSNLITDKADLAKLRDLGRKVVIWTGLVDDAIPPAGNINYHERVLAQMGGHAEVAKFMRMYLVPGAAHSSQGRAYTVGGKNDTVPMPKLPGNANQTPTREQDQFFTALVDWVEKGEAPGDILLTSRDKSISYPICVYPLKTTWNGSGPITQATSFGCR
ncbi:tannase/feruloyl esterase family alpha/beta hydrolase [Bradyrhizobium sp. AUGA SZCCT0240]|uniref:tannase/feruloyl esterase family alpha/beta hydrolase n=1 Tax=unclassified Bradyrhizobium TaxID=2631580 RepID=UPI001BA713C2|nr:MULTISPECIES: tannase/feruloyl esterase family alpha/beta hydrolase [unclassified Bradyrhizobium]MBR1199216.1 tannase/feruloyl esterase family alpha/beta hydrolase [Bradyrhizobium sp. AUGA SZCCT0158]MBR1239959.1 tannase/feruloyl esterase family alpha/beta hydrolase [Bradyrhizobium sp. AUGA SZCCT0274]MBR1257400.1 tannase/feruloyl esterase family alpha/beta hydrolase [Bradyrhizobium sp. AUGA SZCCT0240]